jgi:hypothetical protein
VLYLAVLVCCVQIISSKIAGASLVTRLISGEVENESFRFLSRCSGFQIQAK